MTVSTTTNTVVYRGNGAATTYAVPFLVKDEDHLVVKRRVFATGVIDLTYIGTDYSYAGIDDPSGTLTLDGAALADTYELVITRVVPYTQDLDIVNTGGFYPETVEDQLDLLEMQIQQVKDMASRSIRLASGEETDDLDGDAARANMFPAFDAAGNLMLSSGTGADSGLRTDLAALTGSSLVKFLQSGAGAVARTVQERLRDTLNILDFGADPTGVVACDSALTAALAQSYADYNKPIQFPTGVYKFTDHHRIGRGVWLVGEGSQGTTETGGTVFKHYSNDDFLTWDSSSIDFLGTGGGLLNVLIAKADTFAGGNAITLLSLGGNKRPGEMWFQNILVLGIGAATWEHGAVIDGTLHDAAGARGVRCTHWLKCRFADCSVAGQSILLKNATHTWFWGVQTDTGTGAQSGIKLEGHNENVFFPDLNNMGAFEINANDGVTPTVAGLYVTGTASSSFVNNDTLATGSVDIEQAAVAVITNKSSFLRVRSSVAPAFCLRLAASTAADKTGDGTVFLVTYDTEVFDRGNNTLAASSGYTDACAGLHRINASITLLGLDATHDSAQIDISRTGSATTTITKVMPINAAAYSFQTLDITADLDLVYADVVRINVAVLGGTKTVGILGHATTRFTYLEGKYEG